MKNKINPFYGDYAYLWKGRKNKLADFPKVNNNGNRSNPASLFSHIYCQLRTTINNGIIWNNDNITGKTCPKQH